MNCRYLLPSVFCCGLYLLCAPAWAHPADEDPALALPATTEQYRLDRFGLMIHWGLYSVLCDGETVAADRDIAPAQYEKLAGFFNPSRFNAAEWVSLAKTAGVRYITLMAKADDGFAMWDSAVTDWNVVKRTPFARDPVKELSEECHRQAVKLFVGYSPPDWRHAGIEPGAAADVVTTEALAHTESQLIEVLTKYGHVDGLRLEGWWRGAQAEAYRHRTYQLIRALQPAALLGNAIAEGKVFPGEDFDVVEGRISPDTVITSSTTAGIGNMPIEVNDTINGSRGYRLADDQYKSERELLHGLVRAAGADANYQLHIGAMPNGEIPSEFADRLRRIGMWLAKNGDSIYSTRGGPVPPQPWGVTTQRDRKVYVHVLDAEAKVVTLPLPPTTRARSARYFSDEQDVAMEQTTGSVSMRLRAEERGELERVLVLEMWPTP